jgi:hypothetical protein
MGISSRCTIECDDEDINRACGWKVEGADEAVTTAAARTRGWYVSNERVLCPACIGEQDEWNPVPNSPPR